ncbi:hypothetical protein [Nocardia sp. NBC_00416]|uniref:hypothetical protein n=1 Tax=Nocardia sp. NBC_00416 TaxID=2975991 RepID=UPI002E203542
MATTRSAARGAAQARRRTLRHRAVVVTPTVADAVDCLGGWMFDRTMAGSETIVLTPCAGHARALEILGATATEFGDLTDYPEWATGFEVLAVAADVHTADARVQEMVRARRDLGMEQTYFWGRCPAIGFGREFAVATSHQVSLAGHAFKCRALDAVGTARDPRPAAEMFWTYRGPR